MQIVVYCIYGNKQYVVFGENKDCPDRPVNAKNAGKYKNYKWVDKQEVDLKKIISRMCGARPWHPLLELLRKEAAA